MRRRILTLVVLCLTTALAGCTPGDEPSTPASWSPVPPLFTPEPSPSPSWNDDEQAAINAVQNYLDIWAKVSHDLNNEDWDQLHDVASDDEMTNIQRRWVQWFQNNWHLVGAPVFTPSEVEQDVADERGYRYTVWGCFVITDSYLADSSGQIINDPTRVERGTVRYTVLRIASGKHFVISSRTQEASC